MDWDDIDQGFLPAVVYGHPSEHVVASDGSVIDTVKPEDEDRPEGAVDCDGCRGDGIYYGRGSVVNGVFVGFTGTCFRCHGKGFQTEADSKRCRYYDNHVRRFTL